MHASVIKGKLFAFKWIKKYLEVISKKIDYNYDCMEKLKVQCPRTIASQI